MKVTMTIEVELEKGMELTMPDEREWAEEVVFVAGSKLTLYSEEIGDTIGTIAKIENFKWIDDGTID